LWAQVALSTPVVLWAGWPFFVRGWNSIVTWNLNMFTLIAIGTGAAYFYSLAVVLKPAKSISDQPEAVRPAGRGTTFRTHSVPVAPLPLLVAGPTRAGASRGPTAPADCPAVSGRRSFVVITWPLLRLSATSWLGTLRCSATRTGRCDTPRTIKSVRSR